MSEVTVQEHVRAELKAMEKARKLLGGEAGKWRGSPYTVVCVAGLLLLISLISGTEISPETMVIVFLAAVIGSLDSQMRTTNKRIDKIVELTAVQKTLEEKYESYIRSIAECSRLASSQIDDKADNPTA